VTVLALALAAIVALGVFTAVETRRIEARYPPTGARVDVGGGAVHVLERPQRKDLRGAVVMVHGASGNAADLGVALAERLSEAGFRVLSVDRPGHGWSARIAGRQGPSPVVQSERILGAAKRLGVTQAIVIGHSLGCITSLALALEAPEFVRALTLIAPVSHPWPGGVAWYYSVGAHPLLGPPFRRLLTLPVGMAWMASAVKGVFAPNPAPRGFIEATRLPLVLRPLHFRANCEDVAHAEAAVDALWPRYGAIRAPTEIVTGDSDSVVYAQIHSAGCARDIPGARLTTLAGVGHSPHHVMPERIVEVVLEADRRAQARETETAYAKGAAG
jgi:pimeloyl-ACP methyl ester carboxylesterase